MPYVEHYQTVEEDCGVEYIHEHETAEEAIQHAKNLEEEAKKQDLGENEYTVFAVKVSVDIDTNEETTEYLWTAED